MRYLAIPELQQLNALLTHIDSDDGSRISGRLEAYSCKAAGSDKKLWKRLENRFLNADHTPSEEHHDSTVSEGILSSSPPSGSALAQVFPEGKGMTVKSFYQLVSTMNLLFPDYDFSDLKPEVFVHQDTLASVINYVNTTIFNTGVNKNVTSFNEFSSRMWKCIDMTIDLSDTEIYSFRAGDFELEDPFWERGCIWSFNYFFCNRRLKRILLFTCRAVSNLARDYADDRLSQRSSTPVPPL